MVKYPYKLIVILFTLLTLDLVSNTNRFIINTKRKCEKHDVQLSVLLVTSIKTSKKCFSFTYLKKENNPEVFRPESTPKKFYIKC